MTNTMDEETVEAQSLSTSLDPYGQLVKMLMPRATTIAIYDRLGTPLWLSDGYDGHDLAQLVEEALNAARNGGFHPDERDGFARSWDGETTYVFILRDGEALLGALALACQDGGNGARPFGFLQGLLRPVLQVLGRELVHQSNIEDLRRDLSLLDADLAFLVGSADAELEHDEHDLAQLIRNCAGHFGCSYGALLVPDKDIVIAHLDEPANAARRASLEQVLRKLFAWAQVQRRTLLLNKATPNSPLGSLPYKILACPIREGAHEVAGLLMFAKPSAAADFDGRQLRIVELMTRRIASVLQNVYDHATGLLTRAAFEQRALAQLAGAAPDTPHCVALVDIDRLHAVNENNGMHVGDEVIQRLAAVLRRELAPTALAARISGGRFAIFFPDASVEVAHAAAEQLRHAVTQEKLTHDGKSIEFSVSIGVAALEDTRLPLSHALATAEIACKAAKERGRDRVEFYEQAKQSSVPRSEELKELITSVGDLREALANDCFRMEAQPIVDLATKGPPRRFELLLRMLDPAGDSIAPDKFFAAAERHQLATDIDRWVVQFALEVLSSAAPTLEMLGAQFSINISGQSLADEDFLSFLESKLREYELPPRLLSFEIPETVAVTNIVRAEMLIRRLQDLGHTIALDDFGRGLSSLSYLKSLPVSHLKIDGRLIRDLTGKNPRSKALVSAIVQLAQSMKLETTAECVENEAILAAVTQLGVDFGQGFAIGRPRPLETVLQELLKDVASAARSTGASRLARIAGM